MAADGVRPVLVLAAVLAFVTTACAGSDPHADPTGATSRPAESLTTDPYPVTVDHAHGSTTIEHRPETVVSLNVQWTDALLAMGEPPKAYVLDSASGETEPYPWHEDRLADTQVIEIAGELPFEQLASLQPDLILATHLAQDAALFDRLAEIAPTVGLLGGRDVDRWQDQVQVLGQVLDEAERADRVVADVEAALTDTADALPALQDKTYALANYLPGDSIWVVADPDDGASALFAALGMHIAPDLLAAADGATGRVQLSFEQVGLLESDLLAILPNDGDPHALVGYDDLTPVRTGAVAEMGFADVVGVNTPTPLSLPYVLGLLRPALEAAAAA